MNIRRFAAVFAATAITTTTFALAGSPASAEPGFDTERAELAASVDPGMLDAVMETFGYSADEALDRLTTESLAAQAEPEIRELLGDDFAGLWLDDGRVHVAVTDAASTGAVDGYGYETTVVKYSEAELLAWQATLDRGAIPDGVTTTHIDPAANRVVITALPEAADAAADYAAGLDVPAEVVVSEDVPQTTAVIRGGDAYYINNSSRCSVGFAVNHGTYGNGFVTAGHCGRVGASVTGGNGGTGTFRGSSFPGNDYAWVDAASSWTNTDTVNRYNGTTVSVNNANEAAVGSSVCRSGSTTGWRCGTIQAKNQTVYYSQGTVSGLTLTTACAEPGDSGGSFITGNSAQGMTSGGSGNCRTGGRTYFQPVREALSAYSLTLVT
ncbi:streptogrisin C [Stackebrandtia albiflava]|uniref:Streptogrisin C n=1 Tax=Stackebrandtia albiflava TaxID=406432 RepID=A0A562URK7_9ACTN|nr:S1 family peptidase [Stackebrandtia albiflava]TWJ08255.1 streptogrisin C [Stackebrandtia albiflava]